MWSDLYLTAVFPRISPTEIKGSKIQLVEKISFSFFSRYGALLPVPQEIRNRWSLVSSHGKLGWKNGMGKGANPFPDWALRSLLCKWVGSAYTGSRLEFKSRARLGQTWKGFQKTGLIVTGQGSLEDKDKAEIMFKRIDMELWKICSKWGSQMKHIALEAMFRKNYLERCFESMVNVCVCVCM